MTHEETTWGTSTPEELGLEEAAERVELSSAACSGDPARAYAAANTLMAKHACRVYSFRGQVAAHLF